MIASFLIALLFVIGPSPSTFAATTAVNAGAAAPGADNVEPFCI